MKLHKKKFSGDTNNCPLPAIYLDDNENELIIPDCNKCGDLGFYYDESYQRPCNECSQGDWWRELNSHNVPDRFRVSGKYLRDLRDFFTDYDIDYMEHFFKKARGLTNNGKQHMLLVTDDGMKFIEMYAYTAFSKEGFDVICNSWAAFADRKIRNAIELEPNSACVWGDLFDSNLGDFEPKAFRIYTNLCSSAGIPIVAVMYDYVEIDKYTQQFIDDNFDIIYVREQDIE